MAQNRRRCNEQLLIYRLPAEVTVQIFRESLPSYLNPDYFNELKVLYSVCFHWKALIDNTTSFWAGITNALAPSIVAMALRKSGESPLRIASTTFLREGSDFVNSLRQYVYRCSDVSLYRSMRYIVDAIISTPAPLLESLLLHMDDGVPMYIPEILAGSFPRLKRMSLQNVGLSWDRFANLTSLHVERVPSMTHEDFHGLLTRCPDLTSLHIRFQDAIQGNQGPSTPRVSLPRLRDLRLAAWGPMVICYLLNIITSPPHLTTLNIRVLGLTNIDVPLVLHSLTPWQHCIEAAIIASGENLTLTLDSGELSINADLVLWGYAIALESGMTGEILDDCRPFVLWHTNILNRVSLLGISVGLSSYEYIDFGSDELLPMFLNLWAVTSLSLNAILPDPAWLSLLDLLARPLPRRDGETVWLFPQLETFDVARLHSKNVLKMLRGRLTLGLKGSEATPSALTTLWLTFCRRKDLEELNSLFGGRCVIHYTVMEEDGSEDGSEEESIMT